MIDMSTVNDLMEELENEVKYLILDGEAVSIRDVIDRILSEDNEKKRKLSEG